MVPLALVLALSAAPASAPPAPPNTIGFLTGADLATLCAKSVAECTAYVFGVVDTAAVTDVAAGTAYSPCLPAGVSGAQLAEVVRRYLAANPDTRADPGSAVVLRALRDNFRCARPLAPPLTGEN